MSDSLRSLAPDLWVAERPFKLPGLPIGARMTVVRLGDGGVLLHSPVELDAELRAALEAIGPVRHVVAPNKVHHLFAAAAHAAFPDARAWAAPGLREKRKALRCDAALEDTPPPGWSADLDQHIFRGAPFLNEVAFLHHSSRTLILTDLVFNIQRTTSLLFRGYLRLTRSLGQPSQTTTVRLCMRDRAAARRSRDHILGWDFDRVIVSHGDVVESDGHDAFARALAWL